MNSRTEIGKFCSAWIAIALSGDPALTEERNGLVFLCPFEVLQEAYADLTNPTDALSLLAIERHVLAICRESQTTLLEIYENNRRLNELFTPDIGEGRISASRRPDIPEATETGSGGLDAGVGKSPVFELVAVTRQAGGERVAILKADGVIGSVRTADELDSGHRVTEVHDDGVVLSAPDGTDFRIE